MDDRQKDNPYGIDPNLDLNDTTRPRGRLSPVVGCAIGLWASLTGVVISFVAFLGTISVNCVGFRMTVDGDPKVGLIAGGVSFLLVLAYAAFRFRRRR